MLTLIEEAGSGALLLVEGLEPGEFTRSRLTRAEVCRQLRQLADTLLALPEATQAALPEIDWDGWRLLAPALVGPAQPCASGAPGAPAADDPVWFAVQAMVPATLSWLRLYRQQQPALFAFKPA